MARHFCCWSLSLRLALALYFLLEKSSHSSADHAMLSSFTPILNSSTNGIVVADLLDGGAGSDHTYIVRTFYRDPKCQDMEYDYAVGILINTCMKDNVQVGSVPATVQEYKHVIVGDDVYRVAGCGSSVATTGEVLLRHLNYTSCTAYTMPWSYFPDYNVFYRDWRLNYSIDSFMNDMIQYPDAYTINSVYSNIDYSDEHNYDFKTACINQIPKFFEIISNYKCVPTVGLGWSYSYNTALHDLSFSYFTCKGVDSNRHIVRKRYNSTQSCETALGKTVKPVSSSSSDIESIIFSKRLNSAALFLRLSWDWLLQTTVDQIIHVNSFSNSSFLRRSNSRENYSNRRNKRILNIDPSSNLVEEIHITECGLFTNNIFMFSDESDLCNVSFIDSDYYHSSCSAETFKKLPKVRNAFSAFDSKTTLLIILGGSLCAFLLGIFYIYAYRKWSYVYNKQNFTVLPMPGEKGMQLRKNSIRLSPASTPRSSFTAPYPSEFRDSMNRSAEPGPNNDEFVDSDGEVIEDEDRNEYSLVQIMYQHSVNAFTGNKQRANSWSSVVPGEALAVRASTTRNQTSVSASGELLNDGGNSLSNDKQRSLSIQSGIDDKTRQNIIHSASLIKEDHKSFLAHKRIQAREEEFRQLHNSHINSNNSNSNSNSNTNTQENEPRGGGGGCGSADCRESRRRTASVESIDENSGSDGEKATGGDGKGKETPREVRKSE